MERRLSAIFAADMVGYSRLMEADEVGTLQRHKNHRAELINPTIEKFHGRIVKEIGDGLLVEFPSVVEAVQCAAVIQRGMVDLEADDCNNLRIQYRIGINLGDIIIDDDDIFGDGVNIAARLEQLADPGGICVSGTAYDHLIAKVEVGYKSLGDVRVKNIDRPIRAYKVLLNPADAGKVIGALENLSAAPKANSYRLIIAIIAILLIAAASGILYFQTKLDFIQASTAKMAFPLPSVPSVAVLPFKNITGDPNQFYFSDAITEDIITDLSKLSGIFVVASNSIFSYRDKAKKFHEISEELGVRYLLDGSVQRSESQLRISVRLIDALSGNNIWAERYDGKLSDLFAVQSEISHKVTKALAVTLSANEIERLEQKNTDSIDAYDTFVKARRIADSPSRANIEKAEQLYARVIELDPNFAGGYAGLSYLYNVRARFRYGKDVKSYRKKALELAKKAIEIDRNFAWSYIALGGAHLAHRDATSAVDAARKALSLEPHGYYANLYMGFYLQFTGEGALAVEHTERAKRLSPVDTVRNLAFLGRAYFINEDYGKAIDVWDRRYQKFPISSPNGFVYLAAASVLHNNHGKARETVDKLRDAFPKFSLSEWGYIKLYKQESDRARLYNAAKLAGIPEFIPTRK